jgi:putative Ca2+/H+ antiporter (TMEM165/GDT1 family)
MDVKLVVTVFTTVFLAELGDKTQLSTMLFAASPGQSKWAVFMGASLALVTSTALGVFAGQLIGARVNPQMLARIAGLGFIAVGVWTLLRA